MTRRLSRLNQKSKAMPSTLGIRQDIAVALLLVLVLGKAGVVCWLLLTLLRMEALVLVPTVQLPEQFAEEEVQKWGHTAL